MKLSSMILTAGHAICAGRTLFSDTQAAPCREYLRHEDLAIRWHIVTACYITRSVVRDMSPYCGIFMHPPVNIAQNEL